MDEKAPFIVLMFLGMFAGIAWIAWVVATNMRLTKVGRAQAEAQARLLDKLGSSQELASFLQTDAGRKLLDSGPPPEPRRDPVRRILVSVQGGLMLAMLGVGFYVASIMNGSYHVPRLPFLIPAVMFGALGMGLLISAVATYVLSKQWGLLPGQEGGAERSDGGAGNR
jgi:hypothetical protein